MVVLFEVPEESSSTHGHNSTFAQSSSTHVHRYDVFLSFRGSDTRHSFTDHLHKALIDANIATFLDDEEIETGEDLKPELESAIKASQASIIVLSEKYATSTWCLDELVLILEQRTSSNHIVIPIFYHVEPFHVRWQEGSFGDAMVKHKQTMEAEIDANKRSQWAQKIDRWSKALLEVANLKGMSIKGRPETKFIEEIVKDIYHRLPLTSRNAQPLLIGLEYHINFVASWLKDASSHTTDILTISGMGGIGKTYLANYVYGIHCREFHISSYIEDISRRCAGKFNGLLDIQKQLCDRISKTRSIQVYDGSIYTSMIENVVAREKVFIVLDDIDSTDQLDALLGSRHFHPGSKVIITTRNTWLTESCALFKTNIKPKNESLLLRGLDEIESQQLLCFHAFTYNHPKAGYEEVSNKIVKYCEGHPLALKVLGKSLYNRDVAYWEGCIEGLMRETDTRINNVLRLSLDSLPSNNDKELFKYIACYFVGIDRDVTETILEACNINTRSGITNLLDRFLLSIGGNNVLKMHQLVQEMGRSEVRHESLDKPWKRSRLWCHKESFRVLKQKKGKGNMVGLALDMRMLEKENLDALQTDVLSNMDSLMLLQLNYVHMNGSYENFPEELRCLCMHGFRLKSIPLELPMRNLVALDMSYSNIESFVGYHSDPQQPEKKQKLNESSIKEKRLFRSLKILNLSFCKHLHSLGDFEQLPALERLIVRNCIDLVEVCESIEQCVELVVIDLSYCNKLEKLPRNIYKLKKVKTMWLDGSNLGTSHILIRDMESMETCKTNKIIDINRRTNFTALVGCMPRDLKFFASSLPSSLVRLSLANSNLSTDSFPTNFSCLPMLEKLYLDDNPIDSMPQCVRTLPKIKLLSMTNCNKLKSVEHPPHTLRELSLYSDRDAYTKKVVFNLEMSPLILHSFSRSSAPGPYEFEGMIKIQSMVDVDDKVLRSLGWTDIDLLKEMYVGTNSSESKFQEEMPNWVRHRSVGPSISFTIPSSPNNLRGLNFSSTHMWQVLDEFLDEVPYGHFPLTPMITVSNITKNRMWIYERFRERSCNGGNCWVLLSHWMFGRNEMEGGDHVTITVTERYGELIKECGVSLVYDDLDEEEEDALTYYKSWNHIIGGDLSPFQTTTGECILNNFQFFFVVTYLFPYHRKFIPDGPDCQERYKPWFRALSPRKPDIISGTTSSAS